MNALYNWLGYLFYQYAFVMDEMLERLWTFKTIRYWRLTYGLYYILFQIFMIYHAYRVGCYFYGRAK